ncbi:MAG: tagaturonate epimerase family protein [Chloroflexota bacterium]
MTMNIQLDVTELAPQLPKEEAQKAAASLSEWSNMNVYPSSLSITQQSLFFFGHKDQEKFLGVLTGQQSVLDKFDGLARSVSVENNDLTVLRCPTSALNAAALRTFLPFLTARTWGLEKSAGTGDRLGLATPGHIRSFRNIAERTDKGDVGPILAQQSIRENVRTGRTPQEVMDDAMWGALQEGWRTGFGADADHLKNTDDIDTCAAAGYTFYTIDPGEYVDDEANNAPQARLLEKSETLPWETLDTNFDDLKVRLTTKAVDLGGFKLTISEEELLRAAVKYGPAVAHTVKMYRHLSDVMSGKPFEFEMSVDETETITTLAEHNAGLS